MNKKIIVYSAKGCRDCELVKEFLTQEGIEFEVRDLLTNPQYQQEVEGLGFMGIPVTSVGNQAVKGFNPVELNKLIEGIK